MRILIAEDDSTTQIMLTGLLSNWGHQLTCVETGDRALEILLSDDSPGIAILDWMMPGHSGVEICRRVREANLANYRYLILLTAKDTVKDIDQGYQAGADDFIIKPFNSAQLQHRISVGQRVVQYDNELVKSKQQLAIYAEEMEHLAEKRAEQLAHAERMATIGVLSAGVAHEVNNPATFITGNAQVLRQCWPVMKTALESYHQKNQTPTSPSIEKILIEVPNILDGIETGIDRISKIVKGLKSYAGAQKKEKEPFNINQSIQQSFELCRNRLKGNIKVTFNLQEDLPNCIGDSRQFEQVFVNLFLNSADALGNRKNSQLRATSALDRGVITVIVEDNGPGMTDEVLTKLWQPFFTTKATGVGTGLGLPIIREIIENHGGTINAENNKNQGARFVIKIPVQSASE